MDKKSKCACPTCNCIVTKCKAVVRQGKTYCSTTCANDCTAATCVCVHDGCDEHKPDHKH